MGPGAGVSPLGAPLAVEGLFATITYRLEPGGRGSRFPLVMNRLYAGRLDPKDAPAALTELAQIEAGLLALTPNHVVWSLTDLRRRDDRNMPVNHAAGNVRDYFVTADGRPIVDALRDTVLRCRDGRQAVELTTRESAGQISAGWILIAVGSLWTIIGYLLFPDVVMTSSFETSKDGGVLLWPTGLIMFAAGCATLIGIRYPGIKEWFQQRVWLSVVLLLILVGVYVVFASRG
jgi:hypothetical protein